jgi:hypothetical protein
VSQIASVLELPLTRSRKLGDFTLHVLEAGQQRLDGGAMFGVVPKPLWQKRIATAFPWPCAVCWSKHPIRWS